MEQELLQEIRNFLKSSKMGPSYFGKRACGNSEVIARLESGKTVTLRTSVRIRTFISEHSNTPRDPLPDARATGAAQGTA
jgi:hypothetical protein